MGLLTFSDSIRSNTHFDASVLPDGTVAILYADARVNTEGEGSQAYDLNLVLCPEPSC